MESLETQKINGEHPKHSYPKTPRKKIIENILNDEQIKNIIKRVAKRNNSVVFIVQRRAKKVLKEMVANISVRAIRISYKIFKFIWKRLYTRLYVDFESLEKVKPVIQNNPVILIPPHKSHLDYLLLSSIFHENGLTPPYIAAGVNLSFWPLGYIFRKTGAFFTRRSIGNDILYYKLLFKYISFLIKENGTQEFFIEGGRSRNGKLQNPKLGLLTLQIDTFLEEGVDNLFFIPISISYDRILEENAYYEEITGGQKIKETIWEVVKSKKVLKSNYGNAYVQFGTPISLKEYLKRFESKKLTPKLKKKMIKELAGIFVKTLNYMTPVTPTSLIALSLLSQPKKQITHDDLFSTAMIHLSYLKQRKVNIAPTKEADEKLILSGITFLTEANFLKTKAKNKTKVYYFKTKHRISLDYYKNNIIHFCVPLLFVTNSIFKEPSGKIGMEELKNDFDFLLNLFANEFFIEKGAQNEIGEIIEWLINEKIISNHEENGKKLLSVTDRHRIEILSNALKNYLEAYYVTALSMSKIVGGEVKVSDANPNLKILKIGLKMLRKGQILTREAITIPYINNALKYINRNIIYSLKNLLPTRDLEEEDDNGTVDHDAGAEWQEQEKLANLIATLKKFLRK